MDEHEEAAENIRKASAAAPRRRAGGCGCVGWGIGAIVLLLLADGVLHIWFPLLFVLLLLIVAGMGFALLVGAIRTRGAVRGPFDPRNADWHPRALVEGSRPGPAQAGGRPAEPPAAPPDPPPAASPAGTAGTTAAAGAELSAPSTPVGPAEDARGPATTDASWPPEAPEAPEAPKAPDWA